MDIQKLTWILERTLYYTLLLLSLGAVIFSFANEYPLAGLISLLVLMAVIHKGFANITIQANSVAVNKDDKVVFFVKEKSVLKRFDFVSRGQHIVTLPEYGLFDHPYKLEFFFPSGDTVSSCLLTLKLGYGLELPALQCAYESYIRYQSRLAEEVRQQLLQAASGVSSQRFPEQSDGDPQEYLQPIVAELNRGLSSMGVEIKKASCSFDKGNMLVRV